MELSRFSPPAIGIEGVLKKTRLWTKKRVKDPG
jgi:hypothetical protein